MEMRAKGCHVGEEPIAIRRTIRMNEMKEKMVGGRALKDRCEREGMVALEMGGALRGNVESWRFTFCWLWSLVKVKSLKRSD